MTWSGIRPIAVRVVTASVLTAGACLWPVAGCAAAPVADETATLQQQLDGLAPGGVLRLDRRTYGQAGVLRVTVPGVTIDGNGATLAATNDETSAVQIRAHGVTVKNLNLTAPAGEKRWDAADQQRLAVIGGNGVTIDNVTVRGSAAAGIYLQGVDGFRVSNTTVSDTRADGIHMTGGSANGVLTDVATTNTGDDGVAVVSYSDAPPCHDITVIGPVVNGTTHGRGVSVVGGDRVRFDRVNISDTAAAGVYVASEGDPYNTRSVNDVSVNGGTVTRANQDPDTVNGAVLVYSGHSGTAVTDVQIDGLDISGTPESAQRDVGLIVDHGNVRAIAFTDLALDSPGVDAFSTNAPPTEFSAAGWTQAGQPVSVG